MKEFHEANDKRRTSAYKKKDNPITKMIPRRNRFREENDFVKKTISRRNNHTK